MAGLVPAMHARMRTTKPPLAPPAVQPPEMEQFSEQEKLRRLLRRAAWMAGTTVWPWLLTRLPGLRRRVLAGAEPGCQIDEYMPALEHRPERPEVSAPGTAGAIKDGF